METIEMIVYLTVAIITGILFIGFLSDWQFEKTYSQLSGIVLGEQKQSFKQVGREEFIAEMYSFWQGCGYGQENASLRLYLKENGNLTKSAIFSSIKNLSLCETMQSLENSCGSREDMIFSGEIELPSVIKLSCNSSTIIVS